MVKVENLTTEHLTTDEISKIESLVAAIAYIVRQGSNNRSVRLSVVEETTGQVIFSTIGKRRDSHGNVRGVSQGNKHLM